MGPNIFEPTPRRGRRIALIATATIAILVVLVLAGALHPAASAPATTFGTPLLYSQAAGPAAAAQASTGDGPWTDVTVMGIGSGQSAVSGSAAQGLGSGCSTRWYNTTNFVLPATPSNGTAGKVASWIVVAENATGAALLTFVSNTAGTIVASNVMIVVGSCTSNFDYYGTVPGSVIDSSAAVSRADTGGGSGFLAANHGATVVLELTGPYWFVLFTTCSFFSPSGSGKAFEDELYAANGTTFDDLGASSIDCSGL